LRGCYFIEIMLLNSFIKMSARTDMSKMDYKKQDRETRTSYFLVPLKLITDSVHSSENFCLEIP